MSHHTRPTEMPRTYLAWRRAVAYADALARLRDRDVTTLGHHLARGAAENA